MCLYFNPYADAKNAMLEPKLELSKGLEVRLQLHEAKESESFSK